MRAAEAAKNTAEMIQESVDNAEGGGGSLQEQVERVVDLIDIDDDGRVSWQEFLSAACARSRTAQNAASVALTSWVVR